MAITGRVPLLLLLGLVAVVLRPRVGTMWLWVLVVLAAGRASTWPWRRRPRRVTVERLPVGRVRAGQDVGQHARRRQRRAADVRAAGPRRVAADGRRARQPAPAAARRR